MLARQLCHTISYLHYCMRGHREKPPGLTSRVKDSRIHVDSTKAILDAEACSSQTCRCPLEDLVEELSARAQQEGALGLGTERYLNSAKAYAVLPDGAEWYTVRVKYSRYSHQNSQFKKFTEIRLVILIGYSRT